MSENKDLILESRYIHTGNSGVTISVERDVKQPTRAILTIHNGAFGAFSTDMTIRGNDHDGMSAIQLRDLALVFLESADLLDEIKDGKPVRYQNTRMGAPCVIGANNRKRKTPERIRKFVQDNRIEALKIQGQDPEMVGWPIDLMKDFEEDENQNVGCDTVASRPTMNMSPPEPVKKHPPIDQEALVTLRLKHLVGKL